MDAYVEVRLLPDPEFSPSTLMNVLFDKLHRGLVAHGGGNIGVSFPDVATNSASLGQRLRLHGNKTDLERLMTNNWFLGMTDHATATTIAEVPARAKQRVVRRVQAKSSPERERRRLIARKGVSAEHAAEAIPDSTAEKLSLPYLALISRSTGQKFRLFVEHMPVQEEAVIGKFSPYGLSATATIPWF